MLKDLDITPNDPAELRAVSRLLADEVKSQALMIEKLKHQLAGQNRHRFGVRSESQDQLNLTFEEDEAIGEAASEQTQPEAPSAEDKPPRQHSRKPLPDHLERHDEVLSPGEDYTRCGGTLKTLGEDVTEELEYVPGRFVVNRIIRPRKACAGCEAIVQSPLPSRPIERGRPGPGLLAHGWSANTLITCRSIAKVKFTPEKASIWTARQWPIGLEDQQHYWSRLPMRLDGSSSVAVRSLPTTHPSRCKRRVRRRPKRRGSGLMCGMRGHGRDHHPPALGISSRLIARVNIPSAISQATRGESMLIDTPASTDCSDMTRPMRWPAWPMSGASSWMSSHPRAMPLPRKPFAGLLNSMRWKRMRVAKRPTIGSRCVRHEPNPSSMISKHGYMRNCQKYQASRHWPKPYATPLAGCQRRGHTFRAGIWSLTTTQLNVPSNPLPLAGKTGCLQVRRSATKPWQLH